MSFAPIIHEVEEAIDNSRYGVRIHPPDQQIARDTQQMRYLDCNGRSATAFVDALAIIAHVHDSHRLHAGVAFVYDALCTAAEKTGAYAQHEERQDG
eukprot:5873330-Karenia_brevis.AAC.1